ncbi:MAG: hypothetical protein AAGE52_39870, partial [Myxococcota bacterium]
MDGGAPRPLTVDALQASAAEEAFDLRRLLEANVPVAGGYLVDLPADTARLRSALEAARRDGSSIRFLPVFPSRAAADAFDAIDRATGDAEARLDALLEVLQSPAAQRGGPVRQLRIVGVDESPSGGAASVDRDRGDPDEVHVWSDAAPDAFWRVDRRSTRVSQPGEDLDVFSAEAVADLVDRVQLVLGVPVEITWCVQDRGRPMVLTVRELPLHPTFMLGRWSRLALVAADEGTVAPLAIDALDRGLGVEAPAVEPAVRRVYARPYRRRGGEPAKLGRPEPAPFALASAEVGRLLVDAAPILADALRFERGLDARMTRLDRDRLSRLAADALLDAVRQRHRLVAEALLLLDRCREITRRGLEALEAVVGALPDERYADLAAPRSPRTRRRIHDRLMKLRTRIETEHGDLVPPQKLSEATRKVWYATRADLADHRPLGIDVTPLPIGHDDETLLDALDRLPRFGHSARERARAEAAERVAQQARSRGRSRALLGRSLTLLLQRIARAKGGVGEGVA